MSSITDQVHWIELVKSQRGPAWLSQCQQIDEDMDDQKKIRNSKILFKI